MPESLRGFYSVGAGANAKCAGLSRPGLQGRPNLNAWAQRVNGYRLEKADLLAPTQRVQEAQQLGGFAGLLQPVIEADLLADQTVGSFGPNPGDRNE